MAHEKWKSDMHSNANMTTHHISVSPTIHANTTRATFHGYAHHSLADLTEQHFQSWCSLKRKLTGVHTFYRTFRAYM